MWSNVSKLMKFYILQYWPVMEVWYDPDDLSLSFVTNRDAHEGRFNSNSGKENGIVKDLTLFQKRKQVFLKQFSKREFGVHFPPISFKTR